MTEKQAGETAMVQVVEIDLMCCSTALPPLCHILPIALSLLFLLHFHAYHTIFISYFIYIYIFSTVSEQCMLTLFTAPGTLAGVSLFFFFPNMNIQVCWLLLKLQHELFKHLKVRLSHTQKQ